MARIDWSQVDLTRPTADLLRELGCAERTLRLQRQIAGIARTDKASGGKREGSGRPIGAYGKNHRELAMLSMRIDKDTVARLKELANARGISMARCAENILKEYLNG